MAAISTFNEKNGLKPEGQWKGKLEMKNLTKTVELVTTTGQSQLNPNHVKFIKRGCK